MQIVIIGAGPRGLSLCERLIAHGKQQQKSASIILIDPDLPGAVWRTTQNQDLLINSVTNQVTLFTDDSLTSGGPVVNGPTLYEWADSIGKSFAQQHAPWLLAFFDNIDPNGHCPRAVYGLYQQWFYQQLVGSCPTIQLTYVAAKVHTVTKETDGYLVQTKDQMWIADKVILATGHGAARLSLEEAELDAFAQQNHLFYSPPANAADVDFSKAAPGTPLILRGLGLAFFDYVTLLTQGRGGIFSETEGRCHYQPSGEEPLIIAGSHRGVSYHPRGRNQKGPTQQRLPHFLTDQRLAAWINEKQVSADIVLYYLAKEVELVYYQQYLKEKQHRSPADIASFTTAFIHQHGQTSVLHDFGIPSAAIWDWAFFEQPFSRKTAAESVQSFLLNYLKWDLQEAELGNLTGPVSSALEVLKDLREPLRVVLRHQLLSPQDLKASFWQSFVPLNSFLSIGPPLQRTRELIALMEAGIVTLLGPDMIVETTDVFLTYAKGFPQHTYQASQMMEARIPTTAIEATANPLLTSLLAQKLIHPAILHLPNGADFHTGAVAIDPLTNQCLDLQEHPQEGLYCFGIPTEGIHWLTAATAQPGTDAWNLRQADQMAAHIYGHGKRK
ncbi:FAD/NAD(P)-binding protein [Enterococcus sp.]|uniref:FAD/NAD(P)-binding protein n=1 Tax=Enterococcus sp. TaxID=35783 RepID=UPI00289C5B97|nr:FAD/NAD(P)-binding protein [Enterococcus sp.]